MISKLLDNNILFVELVNYPDNTKSLTVWADSLNACIDALVGFGAHVTNTESYKLNGIMKEEALGDLYLLGLSIKNSKVCKLYIQSLNIMATVGFNLDTSLNILESKYYHMENSGTIYKYDSIEKRNILSTYDLLPVDGKIYHYGHNIISKCKSSKGRIYTLIQKSGFERYNKEIEEFLA